MSDARTRQKFLKKWSFAQGSAYVANPMEGGERLIFNK